MFAPCILYFNLFQKVVYVNFSFLCHYLSFYVPYPGNTFSCSIFSGKRTLHAVFVFCVQAGRMIICISVVNYRLSHFCLIKSNLFHEDKHRITDDGMSRENKCKTSKHLINLITGFLLCWICFITLYSSLLEFTLTQLSHNYEKQDMHNNNYKGSERKLQHYDCLPLIQRLAPRWQMYGLGNASAALGLGRAHPVHHTSRFQTWNNV